MKRILWGTAVLLALALPAHARTITAATIGTSSAQVIGPSVGPRMFLSIDNESASATIACNFGGTAALNTGGDYTIAPATTRTWQSNLPDRPLSGAGLNCISSSASTPATIESDP